MGTENYSAWNLLNNYDLQKNNVTNNTVVDNSSDNDFQMFVSKMEVQKEDSELDVLLKRFDSESLFFKDLKKTHKTTPGRNPKDVSEYETDYMIKDLSGNPKEIKKSKDRLTAKKHREKKTEELRKDRQKVKELTDKLKTLQKTSRRNKIKYGNALKLLLKLSLSKAT